MLSNNSNVHFINIILIHWTSVPTKIDYHNILYTATQLPPTFFVRFLLLSPFSSFLHPNRSNSLLPPNPSQTQKLPIPLSNLPLRSLICLYPINPSPSFSSPRFSYPSSRFLSWPPGGFSWFSLSQPHFVICLLRFSVFPNPFLFSPPINPKSSQTGWQHESRRGGSLLALVTLSLQSCFYPKPLIPLLPSVRSPLPNLIPCPSWSS